MSHPKVATLVPKAHLDLIRDDEYFMCLSHAMDDPEYAAFFAERAAEGKYVVMDNSTIELGYPEDFDTYLIKAQAANISEITLPDWFEDSERTLDSANAGLYKLQVLRFFPNVMAIPQGKTVSEWLVCAYRLAQSSLVSTLGISYRYGPMFGGDRRPAVFCLASLLDGVPEWPHLRIHLLGAHAPPAVELPPLLASYRIRGVDSSLPCVYTKHGLELDDVTPRPAIRNIDFLNDRYDEKLLQWNIDTWRAMCTHGVVIDEAVER